MRVRTIFSMIRGTAMMSRGRTAVKVSMTTLGLGTRGRKWM